MGPFKKLGESADLMSGLADRMGIDFGAQLIAHPETAVQTYKMMVIRCSTCSNQAGCATLQAENNHIDTAPDYCRNRAKLNAGGL